MFFENSQNKNVLTTLLSLLKVKYTRSYANKFFNEHPYKNNLLGLSQMLSAYGIKNKGIRIDDKDDDIFNIQTPFVAHSVGEFVVVTQVTNDVVNYKWDGLNIKETVKQFTESWSGFTLLVEKDEKSIEPDYNENRKIELVNSLRGLILLLLLCGVFVELIIKQSIYANPGLTITLIINIAGICIGYLLVLKQMHVHSSYADKICSLFKQSNCNDVLESKASKIFGLIRWSEVGLGYFISNVILLFFFPAYMFYLSIINVLVLPYSFWSIWYQKWKAKQWCPLCLIVMGLLWLLFVTNQYSGHFTISAINVFDLFNVFDIYAIPTLVVSILIPKLSHANKIEQITQGINSLKANEGVFISLLKQQPYFAVEKSTSKIIFGNPDACIQVVILTNPYCNPCAKMHSRVEKLLGKTDNICVRYIFSSFDESLDDSNKFLISAYLHNSIEKTRKIFSEWFEKGKYNKEIFFTRYGYPPETDEVADEFARHKKWINETKINLTPTILVSGYKLPTNYKIEDLLLFDNLAVDTK
jgi:uncharacterized membrane protein